VAQVRALVEEGFQEVVLTGVDIASYGPDLPGRPGLGQLVRRLLALVPELRGCGCRRWIRPPSTRICGG
jgi:threonylcarbamoyladenosine tRNA methylthiotransferase MtaB